MGFILRTFSVRRSLEEVENSPARSFIKRIRPTLLRRSRDFSRFNPPRNMIPRKKRMKSLRPLFLSRDSLFPMRMIA
jgi:hypothetical protein